jgi:5-methylcytosine-specific restriction protein A
MKRAPTPCLVSGCNNHTVYKGRCEEHKPEFWVGSTRKERLPSDWNTRRRIVLSRDSGICYLCGNIGADTVDHVERGDNHDLDNLKAVHDRVYPHCHRYKTSREALQAKKDLRDKWRNDKNNNIK